MKNFQLITFVFRNKNKTGCNCLHPVFKKNWRMNIETYKIMQTYLSNLIDFVVHTKLTRHQRTCVFFEIKEVNNWIVSFENYPDQNHHSSSIILQSKMNKDVTTIQKQL